MRTLFVSLLFVLLIGAVAAAQPDDVNIIPMPARVEAGPENARFTIDRNTRILAGTDAARRIASVLNSALKRDHGFTLGLTKKRKRNTILIDLTDGGREGSYRLRTTPDQVLISGGERGLFYGVQSLLQLIPSAAERPISIPAADILDEPRFPYRGMHLDVSRHFMPVEFVKRYIDLMSQFKFNYFHWHLTDDQGWRVEIKKYPRLTGIGSKRPETMKEKNFTPYVGDGVPVEGFYTQDQIREVVAYARTRYITVIPEIELPGHSSAALAAYPELGCKADHQYKVQTTWGIFKEVYCPTERTFGFLEDVLAEVIGLFPDSPYIHIGGDEVLKDMWKESPEVWALMERENLKDEHEVQSYFIRRMERFIDSRGKKIIGWDEILEGGLAPNATVMSWRGTKGGIEAARAKHDVIMTPTDYSYFDYSQGDPVFEPINIGGYVTLAKVYSFDPMPKELSADERKYILGGQANIWTEYLKTPAAVEYMAFPRMLAMAEDVWSTPENKDFANFRRRLIVQLARLDKQHVNYRIPEPEGLRNIVTESDTVSIELKPAPGTVVIYTTDGSDPDIKTSERYKSPIEIPLKNGEVATLKTVVISGTGRRSSIYAATIVRGRMQEPVVNDANTKGVMLTVHTGHEGGTLIEGTRSIQLSQFEKRTDIPRPFDLIFGGYFRAPEDGVYEFLLESTGSAAFGIGDARTSVDGNGTRTINSIIVALQKGLHPIQLNYNRYTGTNDKLQVRWAIKGQNWRTMYGEELVH